MRRGNFLNRYALFFGASFLALFLGLRFGAWFLPNGKNSEVSADGSPTLYSQGVLASSTSEVVRVGWSTPPDISAHAAMVADAKTGEVFFNFNPTTRWPLASLTKLMTATIASEQMDLSRNIVLTQADFADGGNSLTQSLEPGDIYSGNDLLKVLLISSSNEAADALARTYSENNFIAAMNAKALTWNLNDTHFADPSGVSAGNQSTLNDFKQLVVKIYAEHPEFFATTRATKVSLLNRSTGSLKTFENTDQFAGRADFLGGKTGTTPEAGENLVVLFSFRGSPVMIVLYGSENRYADAEKLYSWFTHDFIPSN